MDKSDVAYLNSALSSVGLAGRISKLCSVLGYSPEELAKDLMLIDSLYNGKQAPMPSIPSISVAMYARCIGILALTMHLTSRRADRLLMVQSAWNDLQGWTALAWSVAGESVGEHVRGEVADQIRRAGLNPAEPSLAVHTLFSALTETIPGIIDDRSSRFDELMEKRYGKNYTTVEIDDV